MASLKDWQHKLGVQEGRSQKDGNSNSFWNRRMSRVWKINTSKGLCLSQSQTSLNKAAFAFAQTAKCATISFPKLISRRMGKQRSLAGTLKTDSYAGPCLHCTGIIGMRRSRAGVSAPGGTTSGEPAEIILSYQGSLLQSAQLQLGEQISFWHKFTSLIWCFHSSSSISIIKSFSLCFPVLILKLV